MERMPYALMGALYMLIGLKCSCSMMRASSTKPKRGPRNSRRDEQKKFKRKRADQMKENTETRRISNF